MKIVDQVAAVFLDPFQSVLPEPGFLEGVKELAHAHGALLIFDEIVTGFRLALGGAQEYFGVVPIWRALPRVSRTACRSERSSAGARSCRSRRSSHSVTYGGEALSLAAAVAAIDEYRSKDVFPRIWQQGQRLMDGLNDAARSAEVAFRCYGLAPMSAMAFDVPRRRPGRAVLDLLLQEAAEQGVLFRRGGLNFVTYSHIDADVLRAVSVVRDILPRLRRHLDRGTLSDAIQVLSVERGIRQF